MARLANVTGRRMIVANSRVWLGLLLGVCLLIGPGHVRANQPPAWRGEIWWLDQNPSQQLSDQAVDFIRSHEAPEFRAGHRLKPLSLWRALPVDVLVELAENWGHALYLDVRPALMPALADPDSAARRLLSLAASDPQRYPLTLQMMPASLFMATMRDMIAYPAHNPVYTYIHEYLQQHVEGYTDYPEDGFFSAFPKEAFVLDHLGQPARYSFSPGRGWPPSHQLSPMPEGQQVIRAVAQMHADMVQAVVAFAPAAILLNGGEYGFRKFSHHPLHMQLGDPRLLRAWSEDQRPWLEFASDLKMQQEELFKSIVLPAASGAMYVHYSEVAGGHPRRHATRDWIRHDFLYRPGLVTYANPRHYYRHGNSGFTGDSDMLTQLLNTRAQEIDAGTALSYPWLSQGWSNRPIADIEPFQGFTKMLYTSGAVGTINYGAVPHVLETIPQLLVAAQVHALFSHLDDFLFEGDLLPGPNQHRWSRDLPAYEFPTGHEHKRVLVRRHRERKQWLVTAWAADGQTAVVTIDVPELGMIQVQATPGGYVAIYEKQNDTIAQRPVAGVDPHASLAQLGQILKDGNVIDRQMALYHLGTQGLQAGDLLVEALQDGDAIVRRIALRKLVEIDTDKAVDHLQAALHDEDRLMRQTVAGLLAELNDQVPAAAELLQQVQHDPDDEIRQIVAQALWPFTQRAVGYNAAARLIADREPAAVKSLPAQGWRFRLDPLRNGHVEQWYAADAQNHDDDWQTIAIEQAWQAAGYDHVGVAWYQRTFDHPQQAEGQRVLLHFEAVDESAWVWLNGRYVGGHDIGSRGWNVPFRLDITRYLQGDGPQVLTVRVQNTSHAGGIWRPVSLELY